MFRSFDAAVRDLRHALRTIARMPSAAAIIVVSLAAGIGVNTVVFSWIQAVVFQRIAGVDRASDYYLIEPRTSNGLYPGMSWLEYGDLRDRPRAFGDVIAFRMTPLYIGRRGEVERAYGLLVSGNYFEDLGLRPALGRFIDAGGVVPARMFAVLGPMLLVLAAIGIYAVVAYNISQRTVETGVRLALGATRARVIAGLVFESMTVVTLGVMAGWLIAFVAAPAILGGRIDTAVFLGVPAILLAVGAVSCWLPARRARPARSHDRAPRRVTP